MKSHTTKCLVNQVTSNNYQVITGSIGWLTWLTDRSIITGILFQQENSIHQIQDNNTEMDQIQKVHKSERTW